MCNTVTTCVQVLSETVSNALTLHGARETAKFVALFDKFFDLLNDSNFHNGTRTRKPFQHSYRGSNDFRLAVMLYSYTEKNKLITIALYFVQWVEDVFLSYLDKWESSVEAHGASFSKAEKERMLISAETRLGLRMTDYNESIARHLHSIILLCYTARSFVGIVKQIYSMDEVKNSKDKLAFLSVNLCQDPLENYFGCQRQRGGTSNHPNVHQYYQNSQALRVVNSLCRGPIRGNCRGRTSEASMDEECSVPGEKNTL